MIPAPSRRRLDPAVQGRVEQLCRRLPKVELHVHLEGTLSAGRLGAIAARDGLDIDPAALAAEPGDATWSAFLVAFMARLRALRTPDDWATALDDLLAAQHAQGVAWTEAFITPTGALRGDYVLADVLRAMAEVEASWHGRRCGARLILDSPRELGPDVCLQLVRLAAADPTGLVAGIGIGGHEQACPTEAFAPAYRLAADLGLRRTAHAGEHAGAESVVAAVEVLGAQRIGHGLSAADDPATLELLRERGVVVDVCPTSNRATGAWDPATGPHPARRMVEAGVRISVGSDDPAIVGGSVSGEWALLVLAGGFSIHECLGLTVDAVEGTCLDPAGRTRVRAQVMADVLDLQEEAAALEVALAS